MVMRASFYKIPFNQDSMVCLHLLHRECVTLTEADGEVLKASGQQRQQLVQQGGWGRILDAGRVASGLSPGAARP